MGGFELYDELVERAARLPFDRRMVLVLGAIQRCMPFLRHSVQEYPFRAAALSAAEEALPFAWAHPFGDSGAAGQVLHDRLVEFAPEDPDDPVNVGDSSYSACTYASLGGHLSRQYWDDDDEAYARSAQQEAADLVATWHTWTHLVNGREAPPLSETTSSSAFLLELATQNRHIEWLAREPVTEALVHRIRQDSERIGEELLQIVLNWR